MQRPGLSVALLAACVGFGADDPDPRGPAAIARAVLDDSRPTAAREALITRNAQLSDALIAAMVADLTPGTKEEYRRIPWIWRVAIAAGKRNDPDEIGRILERALPAPGGKLDDWRAVVIGGGLINGVTQAGDWPGDRFRLVVSDHPKLEARWLESLANAEAMADDPRVPTGTRYDALRMIGVEPWDRAGGRLFRYLVKGVDPELQMGAISGLGDVRTPSEAVAQALLSGLSHYQGRNLELALEGLLRDGPRATALLAAIADGRLEKRALGAARIEQLKRRAEDVVRRASAGETPRGPA